MLHKSASLKGYKIHCLDGEVGRVTDFYFDDRFWTIRYLVAETGGWLARKEVLISPYALEQVNQTEQYISVNLTKKQILESPSADSSKPVSRQTEEAYCSYYGWPEYWNGPHMWGFYPDIIRDRRLWKESIPEEKSWDSNLRSTHKISGHQVLALDGAVGHVDDFIIDDESWAIRYLLVDTGHELAGRNVLISPDWIDSVSWNKVTVLLSISREAILLAPRYTEKSLLSRDYETALHLHYQRPDYWQKDEMSQERPHRHVTQNPRESVQERM